MADETKKKTCGIVRPIAAFDGMPSEHWAEVHEIMIEALSADFDLKIVSDADGVGVIQGRIVKNLFEMDLVVCDVSGRNPNVMFEFGMRLAFDKPVVVIKDEATPYSFDSSPIEHIPYPRSLRFSQMVIFKEQLLRKALATVDAINTPGYQSFLKHFGPIQVASFEHEVVPAQALIVNQISEMRSEINRLTNMLSYKSLSPPSSLNNRLKFDIAVKDMPLSKRYELLDRLRSKDGVKVYTESLNDETDKLTIEFDPYSDEETLALIRRFHKDYKKS